MSKHKFKRKPQIYYPVLLSEHECKELEKLNDLINEFIDVYNVDLSDPFPHPYQVSWSFVCTIRDIVKQIDKHK